VYSACTRRFAGLFRAASMRSKSPSKPTSAARASLSLRAAFCATPPTTIVVRLATVGPLSGTCAVSWGALRTRASGRPSVSATICGKIVSGPCPMSVLAM
jgi:hypothetical protein